MTAFRATRIVRSFVQHFGAAPERVFPLLCPVREHEWIEPWTCEVLHSDTGFAEKNCVFRTRPPGEPSDETWIVSSYGPPHRIEFVRFNTLRVMTYSIVLAREADGSTSATNEQVVTGLSEDGNAMLARLTDESFVMELRMGEAMLNHSLATGRCLPLAKALAKVRCPS